MAPSDSPQLGKVILLSSVAALGGFLFGFDSGVINGTVSALQESFGTTAIGSGFNVSSMLLGCAAGAFMAGRIADLFGRRTALFVSAILFIVSAFGSGIATSSGEFVVYRLIGGLAVGAASVICPAYISEIAPAKYRGRLASLQQMAIVLGLFAAFLSNYVLAGFAGGASAELFFGYQAWRWMFWSELVFVALFLVGLFFIPESPRFLVAAGRIEDAESVLARIAHPHDAPEKGEEIRLTLKRERRPAMRDILDEATRKVRPIVWVGLGIAALQQLIGINVVFYYGEVLWRAAGFTEGDALLINVIGGIINVSATVGAILLVDRWGRRPLLLLGAVGMALMLGTLALVFGRAEVAADGNLALTGAQGTLALIAANMYIVFFGISWGPVMWVLLGEMFPNQIRGAALSLAGLSQWGTNFLVTMTFPILLAYIGLGGAYTIYAVFGCVAAFFAWKFVAETKGKTLEQMQ
ncbi:MAG: sugar porter family MFS transporter [Opitutales bacterium]|nr:sugar porter family MFS transporter [Opitutales bacterium]